MSWKWGIEVGMGYGWARVKNMNMCAIILTYFLYGLDIEIKKAE